MTNEQGIKRWVDEVAQLFPREAKEGMERELVNRRGLKELLQSPELMERKRDEVLALIRA